MDRRTFLQSAGAATLPLDALNGAVNQVFGTGSETGTTTGTRVFGGEISDIRYPLAFVPSIREPGETLRVELEQGLEEPSAFLQPQVGAAKPKIALTEIGRSTGESEIWPDRTVQVYEYETPQIGGDVVETSYDLVVEHADGVDGQRGAVSLFQTFPDDPRVVVFSDSHIAEGGFDDPAHAQRSGTNMAMFTTEQVLASEPASRWEEVQRIVAEVNLLDPDLVLTTGDYFSVQDYPAKYYMEYEDGHRIYSRLTAPTYTTIGNHDGYVQSTVDGIELYTSYIAPEYYSLDIRPGLRLVSPNVYDWSSFDRAGVGYAVSAWGGQIRDEQFAWLEDDLTSWREANPDGDLVVISHYSPSAPMDERGRLHTSTNGVPVAEQVGRGVDSQFVQGGQYWHGKNRLPYRDLLAEVDAAVHFSGHTHRDLLSRYHEGDVVTAMDAPTHRIVYRNRDDSIDDSRSTAELESILTDPSHGPLFAETTCSSSSTSQYDGYRVIDLGLDGGVDPSDWDSYPADEDPAVGSDQAGEFVDLGLFSTPSKRLSATVTTDADDAVELELSNDLVVPVAGASVFTLGDCPDVTVSGGQRVWRRRHDGHQDVKVSYTVPAESTVTVGVECQSSTAGE